MSRRFRTWAGTVGTLPTGAHNHISDVPGVRVGHVTLDPSAGFPPSIHTGVTAVLPHPGNWFTEKVCATAHVINGFGKTTGLVQVMELGELESPILLTNTFSVPAVTEGAIRYMLGRNADIGNGAGSLNVVVGECNDSYLNDMRGLHVRPEHASAAIQAALSAPSLAEGCVGAGAGMRCFGWKGGIGSASRVVTFDLPDEAAVSADHRPGRTDGGETAGARRSATGPMKGTIGVLVLTNFGVPEDLTILGRPVGKALRPPVQPKPSEQPDGSVMVVLATDLPFTVDQLQRLCKRVAFGLARTGSIAHHGSGDVVIAFSTTARRPMVGRSDRLLYALREGEMLSRCFRAVVEATEEAVFNSLCAAVTTVGREGRVATALPMDKVQHLLQRTTWEGEEA